MVAVLGQTPVATPAPPTIPALSDKTLIDYLRVFALWARNNLSSKLPAGQALPGVLLQAHDAPAGTTPKVFMIQVTTAGGIVATPINIGEGKP